MYIYNGESKWSNVMFILMQLKNGVQKWSFKMYIKNGQSKWTNTMYILMQIKNGVQKWSF